MILRFAATLAGAAQFDGLTAATGLITYAGQGPDPNQGNIGIGVHVEGYSYTTTGAPPTDHAILLEQFNPAGGAAASDRSIFEDHGGTSTNPARNNFTTACGPGGFIITKNADGTTYQMRCVTAGKVEDATLLVWYRIGIVGS